jgi:hypothetical protein
MHKKIVSLAAPVLIGIMALTLGWFAHAALPLSAQSIAVDGRAALPAAPAAPAGTQARLTYQGRLTNSTGAPINTTVSLVFKLYRSTSALLWTSATRSVTPVNGLFTVFLGDGADPNLGSSTLGKAASIGVTVDGDAEMTPRQALNSVIGHSETDAGVYGSSNSAAGVDGESSSNVGVAGQSNSSFGVEGQSFSSIGVYGLSQSSFGVQGFSGRGDGVYGATGVITRAGVLAIGADPSGIALEIESGGIRVFGAGISTTTPVFIHRATASNIEAGNTHRTTITHPLTDGDPDAILIITHNYNPSQTGNVFDTHPTGVFYNASLSQWQIFHEDGAAILTNEAWNVLVVNR